MNRNSWHINRRSFLKLSAASLFALLHEQAFGLTTADAGPFKRLVLLELNGGNDGLNTLVPYTNGAYYDARQTIAIPESQVLKIDQQLGLHPNLVKLHERYGKNQVAIVQGVGHPVPDLSHFAMADYWRAGHLDGMAKTEQTGWIGRTLDALMGTDSSFAGLSIGWEMGPVMYANRATTAAAADANAGYLPLPWEINDAYRATLLAMNAAVPGENSTMTAARAGLANGIGLNSFLGELPGNTTPRSTVYPPTQTAGLLKFAADILAVPSKIRALHIALPLEWDHHAGQLQKQADNFTELDGALDAFITDLIDLGIFDQTLIMTTSEFGRRLAANNPEDRNNAGTDHGTASCLFLIGTQLKAGLHGEAPSLLEADLDADGNVVQTVPFTDVLAPVTEKWLGAPGIVESSSPLDLFVPGA